MEWLPYEGKLEAEERWPETDIEYNQVKRAGFWSKYDEEDSLNEWISDQSWLLNEDQEQFMYSMDVIVGILPLLGFFLPSVASMLELSYSV